jgi:hypothetical protein
LLFLATVLVASIGVYYVNAKVGGTDESPEDVGNSTPLAPQFQPVAPSNVASSSTIHVSGCFDSGGKCRCLDPAGRRIPVSEISYEDCRKMLETGPR